MPLEYLILWSLFGFAAASMAQGKNRRKEVWFFIGLLLGPFAVLIVALMKTAEGPKQKYN